MVVAAAGASPSEDLMKFAANLTIDNEEYKQFNNIEPELAQPAKKLAVHATTQEAAVNQNFERAAERNNANMLELFAHGMETAAPGQ
jgi:uncharacterized membrane protein YdfJ with MMPL/SSD domain